jgi:hypothetical protein
MLNCIMERTKKLRKRILCCVIDSNFLYITKERDAVFNAFRSTKSNICEMDKQMQKGIL